MNQRMATLTGWTAAGLVLAASGIAQTVPPGETAEKPALSGPRVEEKKIPGVESRFGSAGGDRRAMAEGRMPADAMRRLIGSLRGDQVPAELRLTAEQDERITAIEKEHREQVGAYLRDHREELDEIRGALGNESFSRLRERVLGGRSWDLAPDRPPGEPQRRRTGRERDPEAMAPGAGGEMMEESREQGEPATGAMMTEEAARARLVELLSGVPRPAEAGNRVWNVLTEGQRAWVETRLKAARAETDKRMTEAYAQRLMDERREEAGAEAAKPPNAPVRPFNDEMIPPRLRERLASLPEEERARIMSVIRERVERGEWGPEAMRRLRERLDQQPVEKPAPTMESVEVPPPETV